jgi:hypothetical protein
MSLRVTINRVLWRKERGHWPDYERVSDTRRELEEAIDRLILLEIDRHRCGEIYPHERDGRPVKHQYRRGQYRMKPL